MEEELFADEDIREGAVLYAAEIIKGKLNKLNHATFL